MKMIFFIAISLASMFFFGCMTETSRVVTTNIHWASFHVDNQYILSSRICQEVMKKVNTQWCFGHCFVENILQDNKVCGSALDKISKSGQEYCLSRTCPFIFVICKKFGKLICKMQRWILTSFVSCSTNLAYRRWSVASAYFMNINVAVFHCFSEVVVFYVDV